MNFFRLLLAASVVLVCNSTAAKEATNIRFASLESLTVYPSDSAPAEVISLKDSHLAAQISARVADIQVQVGDQAEAGQILLALDCSAYAVGLAQAVATRKEAEAQHALAIKQFDRAVALRKDGSVSEELFNQREANTLSTTQALNARQSAEKMVQMDADHCQIRAPFSGIVAERLIDVGEWVNPGTPVVRLVSSSEIEIEAQLQLDQRAYVENTNAITFTSNGNSWRLDLRQVVPVADRVSRTIVARLVAANDKPMPGLAGRIIWKSSLPHIPTEFVQTRNGQLGVFVLREATATFITLGNAVPGHPAATDLDQHTQIIVEGHLGLNDGQAVTTQ